MPNDIPISHNLGQSYAASCVLNEKVRVSSIGLSLRMSPRSLSGSLGDTPGDSELGSRRYIERAELIPVVSVIAQATMGV